MKLSELHKKMSVPERQALADAAGIGTAYLWQLATGWQGRAPSRQVMLALADADKRLKLRDLAEEFTSPKT